MKFTILFWNMHAWPPRGTCVRRQSFSNSRPACLRALSGYSYLQRVRVRSREEGSDSVEVRCR